MKRVLTSLVVLCLAASFAAAPALAQEKTPGKKSVVAERKAIDEKQAPSNKVPIEEDILVMLIDEPTHHFEAARADFLSGNPIGAANEIRKGASFVKIEYARATPEGRRAIYDSTVRLAELADRIEKGEVSSVETLDAEFARTEQVLAFHHDLMARDYVARQRHRLAGQELASAAFHLEQSMKQAKHELAADETAAVTNARETGRELSQETRAATEKTRTAIENLLAKIEAHGKRLEAGGRK